MRRGANALFGLFSLFSVGVLSNGAWAECSGAPSTAKSLTAKGGEVYDSETDLTWARCSVGMKWVEGKGCIGVATKGSWDQANGAAWPDGWRVPSPEELETIVAKNCKDPAIDERIFPKTADWYWTNRKGASGCWAVGFDSGRVSNDDFCNNTGAVRLVRGGQ